MNGPITTIDNLTHAQKNMLEGVRNTLSKSTISIRNLLVTQKKESTTIIRGLTYFG
jgi:hypothetical protein